MISPEPVTGQRTASGELLGNAKGDYYNKEDGYNFDGTIRLKPDYTDEETYFPRSFSSKNEVAAPESAKRKSDQSNENGYFYKEAKAINKAQPKGGWPAFEQYVRENISKSIEGKSELKIRVISEVEIDEKGVITEIRTIENPGEAFALEAERLIKNWNQWEPGNENGQNIPTNVLIEIKFY